MPIRPYSETLKNTLLTNEDIMLYIEEATKDGDLEILQDALRDCLLSVEYRIEQMRRSIDSRPENEYY